MPKNYNYYFYNNIPIISTLNIGNNDEKIKKNPNKISYKLYHMFSDLSNTLLIRWDPEDESFTIVNPRGFVYNVLEYYSNPRNIDSFVHCLNMNFFRKTERDSPLDYKNKTTNCQFEFK